MHTAIIILSVLLLVSLGALVAVYEGRHHEDRSHYRIIEDNGVYKVQVHEMILDHNGKAHPVWEFAAHAKGFPGRHFVDEYPTYTDAKAAVKRLSDEYRAYAKESFRDYLERKREDYHVVKYFE